MSKNTTNEHSKHDIDPEQIAGMLSIAAEQLDDNTASALRRARHIALERQATRASALAMDSGHGMHWHLPIPHTPQQWLAAILLIAALAISTGYWQHQNDHEMMTHLDVAILTDDLPMEVFVDQ